jgi:hypothetical protein
MKEVISLALSCVLTAGAFAAPAGQQGGATGSTTKTKTKTKTTTKSSSVAVARELQEMKQALDAQQQQIQQLSQQVQTRDSKIQQLEQRLDQSQAAAQQAQSKADAAANQAAQQDQTVSSLKTDVTDLKANATNTALSIQEEQKKVSDAIESPVAIHFKGVTLTPGGFLAAETVYRGHALASDINTPFNSIPFKGASQSNLSEFFASGRQSRASLLAEGKVKSAKLTGYYEADFLSAGVTSNNNQSNSYTFRQRQVWGQVALESGLNVTGGQMWSLVTETKKGLDNRSEALPMTIDPQYTAGFSWARQYGFRVTKNFANKFWLGFSVENPQTTFAGHGLNNNFLLGSAGTGGGLYNTLANYSFNQSPDIIVKAAVEPGFGHYEVFGIFSEFRDRVFPGATATTPTAAGAFNDSRSGGGVGANARVSFFKKHVDVGAHALAGTGVGRYGTVGLPDATARPDGTLALIKSYQGLGTLEFHVPRIDVYLNYGGEYAGRTAYPNFVTGKGSGYGFPTFSNIGCSTEPVPSSTGAGAGFNPGSLSNCTGDTRAVTEGTVGFWVKMYNGPKGRIQLGPQYSYISRSTWAGLGGAPKAVENMFMTSFRYYLP